MLHENAPGRSRTAPSRPSASSSRRRRASSSSSTCWDRRSRNCDIRPTATGGSCAWRCRGASAAGALRPALRRHADRRRRAVAHSGAPAARRRDARPPRRRCRVGVGEFRARRPRAAAGRPARLADARAAARSAEPVRFGVRRAGGARERPRRKRLPRGADDTRSVPRRVPRGERGRGLGPRGCRRAGARSDAGTGRIGTGHRAGCRLRTD